MSQSQDINMRDAPADGVPTVMAVQVLLEVMRMQEELRCELDEALLADLRRERQMNQQQQNSTTRPNIATVLPFFDGYGEPAGLPRLVPSGMAYKDKVVTNVPRGTPVALYGDQIFVEYILTQADDARTLVSQSEPNTPWYMMLNDPHIVTGLAAGLRYMVQGGERRIYLPPSMLYGVNKSQFKDHRSHTEFQQDVGLIYDVRLVLRIPAESPADPPPSRDRGNHRSKSTRPPNRH
ncbi:hypothetical protein HDU86_008531 [Geranomyces michiganensis]|nr:hypothetical protein HDU86_008531 [Geranomyces michiganensis]